MPAMQIRWLVLLAALPCAAALRMPTAPATAGASVNGTRGGPAHVATNKTVNLTTNVTLEEVVQLHEKMTTVATGLERMLSVPQNGSLAHMKVAPALRAFAKELRSVLAATVHPTDLPAAMRMLLDARAGMAGLTNDLTAQQESLMREEESEHSSLLLGVLMSAKAEPMQKQLAILRDPDFARLRLSQDLLAKHDDKTPLFQQAAAYLDAHRGGSAPALRDGQARKLASTLTYFERRVHVLEVEEAASKKSHTRRMHELDAVIRNVSKADARGMQLLRKRSDRQYKKNVAAHHNQLKMMRDVVAALKSGDLQALTRAQAALKASFQALRAHTGNFLHLLQLGHRLAIQRDCPYCAAQCIEKCHNEGNPYAQCLTECANAGK